MTSTVMPQENVASRRIADTLRAAILDGRYRPGERIRQEEVAARSGASRIPVREALRMLDSEGLVTLVANTGAWVASLTMAECAETYMIRERLEPLLLRFSLPGLDEAALRRLAELAAAMEAPGTGTDAFLRIDREFQLRGCAAGADRAAHRPDVEHDAALPARVHQARRAGRPARHAPGAPPAARLHRPG
jgi:DNA-binding GntR family transcriptional regulator